MKNIRKKALIITFGLIAITGILLVVRPHFLEKPFESFLKERDEDGDQAAVGEFVTLWQSRAYPDPSLMQQKYLSAWDRAQELKREAENIKQDAGVNGTTGVQAFNGSWTSLGFNASTGGRILSIAINPKRGNTVYAGSASGGIWKTYNAQAGTPTWQPVTTGYPVLGVSSIAYNPTDTTILYAGTGEVYRLDSTGTTPNPSTTGYNTWKTRGTYGVGVLKSTDGGTTWTQVLIKSENSLFGIQRVRVDPVTPTTVYAAATDGLYQSTNSGGTWTMIFAKTMVEDVVINAKNNQQIVVTVGNLDNTDKSIYQSLNGGSTWTKITSGLPASIEGMSKLTNLTSPGNRDTIYASIGVAETGTPNEIYISKNFGTTWAALSGSNHSSYQFWYAHIAAINPFLPDSLTIGGVNLYSYKVATTSRTALSATVHSDIHDIEYDPNTRGTLYVACDGGIYRSTNGGSNWTAINSGLVAVQFYSTVGVAKSAASSPIVVGGLQDNGIWGYNGTTWTQSNYGSDGAAAFFDPNNDKNIVTSNDARNVYYTTNGVLNSSSNILPDWEEAHDSRTPFVAPLAMSKSSAGTFYVGTDEIFKTTNSGASWTSGAATGTGTNPSTNYIDGLHKTAIAIAISPTSALKVYTSVSPFSQFDNDIDSLYYNPPSDVLRTTTGAATVPFTKINGSGATALPNRYIMHFAISPTHDDSVWVAVGGFGTGHVYVTGDGGVTWTNKDSGLPDVPANAIMLDPNDPKIIYVGNDMGVYVSQDNGTTWSDYNNGFWDATLVIDLEPYPGNKILAATHGKGAFVSPLLSVSLPVTLTSFTGYNNNNGYAVLNWSTSIESDLRSYSLERSPDGVNFSSVANIPAKNIDNSNYTYSDNISNIQNTSTVFYRLKIFNTDGTFVYSNVVPIPLKPQPGIAIAGNPFSDQFTIIFTTLASAPAEARLMDASGRLLIRENFSLQAGTNSVSMQNLGSLAKGTYLLEFIVPGQRFTRKVVKK